MMQDSVKKLGTPSSSADTNGGEVHSEGTTMPGRQLEPVLRHLRSAAGPEAGREPSDEQFLKRYVAGRDGEAFAALVRRYGRLAPMLREALPRAKSPEHRLRLERLLAQLQRKPTPDDWRIMRAVQAAELCRTAEARQLLREWAAGAPGVLLTEQAREALARLR